MNKNQKVIVAKNGPYLVSGNLPLSKTISPFKLNNLVLTLSTMPSHFPSLHSISFTLTISYPSDFKPVIISGRA